MVGASRVFHTVIKEENKHSWPNRKDKPVRHAFVRVFRCGSRRQREEGHGHYGGKLKDCGSVNPVGCWSDFHLLSQTIWAVYFLANVMIIFNLVSWVLFT